MSIETLHIPLDPNFDVRPSWRMADWETPPDKPCITCPNGHNSVMKAHHIDADGVVHGSVLCPREGCGWHVYVTLDEYVPYQATAS